MGTRFANLETRFANLRGHLEERLGTQIKWMFGFWLATLIPLASLIIALNRSAG